MRLTQAELSYDWPAVLKLIQECFAYMHGIVDPPSSVHRLTTQVLRDHVRDCGEVWVFDFNGPVACMVLTPKSNALYVGKISVTPAHRKKGLARKLIDKACNRAKALGYPAIELQVRVELKENIRAFTKMGFIRVGETSHKGYDRPTSITMRRSV